MKTILFFCFVMLLNYVSNAQMSCGTVGNAQNQELLTDCTTPSNYTPDDAYPSHRPIVYIRVNVHFMQHPDGSGNFSETDDGYGNPYPTGLDYAQLMIDKCNERLSANQQMLCPTNNTTAVEPIQIRYVLWANPLITNDNGVYYHQVSDDYYYHDFSFTNWKNLFSNNGTDVVDIYMTNDINGGTPLAGVAEAIGNGADELKLDGAWQGYNDGTYVNGWWNFAALLDHEMGHVIGLYHTGGSQCSDAPEDYNSVWGICNNVMSYNACQCAFTPCQLGIIHEYFTNYYPEYIDESVTCSYDANKTITITSGQNITWNSSRYLQGDVVIQSGGSLTIKCKVGMTENSKIIVKPNGKLTVDGGWITNICGDFWQGIVVEGDKTQDQYLHNNVRYQGYVNLKNSALIEYARSGVALWDLVNANTAGGILSATDASFINCRRGVEFMQYQNHLPNGNNANNISSFTRCTFEVNDDYLVTNDFYCHVSMWDVSGITFKGCKFRNLRSGVFGPTYLGSGIIALDASFNVYSKCNVSPPSGSPCPPNNLVLSEFTGLFKGIDATQTTTNKTYNVSEAIFSNNWYGIYSQAVNNFTCNFSEFNTGGNTVSGSTNAQEGIVILTGTGYKVEENTFKKNGNFSTINGVRVRNSGTSANTIYRNTFDAINNFAAVSEGNNYDYAGGNQTGLEFLCNTFINSCHYDIGATKNGFANSGIRINQGSSAASAGNCFSANELVTLDDIYYPTAISNSINYWYDNSTSCEIPLEYTANKVFPQLTVNSNACTSNFGGGGTEEKVASGGEPIDYIAFYYDNIILFNQYKEVYDALIDGGNTEETLAEISMAESVDALELQNTLMKLSPYLSKDALKQAALTDDVLSNPNLFALYLANPDVLKDASVFDALEEKEDPMPIWMIDILKSGASVKTVRTELEENISNAYTSATNAVNAIIIANLNDSIFYNADTVRNWLSKVSNIESKYALIKSYLDEGKTDLATEVLSEVNNSSNWKDDESGNLQNFQDLHSLLIAVAANGKELNEMETSSVKELQQIAEHGTDIASIEAMGILNFFYGYNYIVPWMDDSESTERFYSYPSTVDREVSVKLFPNPSGNITTIEWSLPDLVGMAHVLISDSRQRQIKSLPLYSPVGYLQADISDLPNGMYVISVHYNDKKVILEKLVILK